MNRRFGRQWVANRPCAVDFLLSIGLVGLWLDRPRAASAAAPVETGRFDAAAADQHVVALAEVGPRVPSSPK